MNYQKIGINLLYGAAGSVIGTGFTTLIAILFKGTDFFSQQFSSWSLIVIIFICFAICFFIYFWAKGKIKSQQRVFIISSSYTSTPFFAELIKNLTMKLEQRGLVPEIKLPQEDFSISEINRYLEFVRNNKHLYLGGFIIHAEPEANFDMYKRFVQNFKKPIVFLDSCNSEIYEQFPSNSSFIGYDNEKTGIIASDLIVDIMRKKQVEHPQILVLASKLQPQRQNNFKSQIEKHYNNVRINDNCDFNRIKAYSYVYSDLVHRIEENKPIWNVIFCTNDEMALGALRAINFINSEKLKDIIIIGVDGIEEAITEIDKGNSLFINTINQNPKLLAEEGMKKFVKKIKKVETRKFTSLSPRLYKDIIK